MIVLADKIFARSLIVSRKGGGEMAAYLVVEHIITDAKKFEEYRTKVGPMITKYGGRYLTKGGSHKCPREVIGNRSGWSSSNSWMR
jgi:hypothetical protein